MQQLLLPTSKTRSKFKTRPLGDLFAERKESGKPGLPTLSVTMHDGMVDREEHGRRVESELTPEQHLLARKNDIAYSLIEKLAPDHSAVEDWVEQVRSANPELDAESLADYIGDKIVWTYTSQGAALALPGAIPGLGTVVQIGVESGAAMTDIALMVRNQSYLVFALSACLGRKGRETLIQDALICMGLWTNALQLTKTGAIRMGTKVVEANFRKRFPASILMAVNKRVSTTVFTKYGTKRGGVAIGKMIPFGVGVAVGGGFNYLTMKAFKKATIRYLSTKAS